MSIPFVIDRAETQIIVWGAGDEEAKRDLDLFELIRGGRKQVEKRRENGKSPFRSD